MHRFTVCVLLYGDDTHAWLHRRCLESIMCALPLQDLELRVGLNDVTASATRLYLSSISDQLGGCLQVFSGENIGKYPRLAQMLQTVTRPYVMWFDDDSYLRPDLYVPGAGQAWLNRIAELQASRPGVLGAIYRRKWRPKRLQWFQSLPGYKGKPVDPQFERFVTGGWWVAPVAMLRELAWPPPELHHNGGDCLLGGLAVQAGYSLIDFRHGVAINADAHGNESKAPRRGLNTKSLGD